MIALAAAALAVIAWLAYDLWRAYRDGTWSMSGL